MFDLMFLVMFISGQTTVIPVPRLYTTPLACEIAAEELGKQLEELPDTKLIVSMCMPRKETKCIGI